LDILNKKKLYFTMKKYFPNDYLSFMPKTYDLNDFNKINNNEIYIIRPIGQGAYQGNGIMLVSNNKELIKAKKIAKKEKKWDWIISKYIKNPLLFNNKKCHFRCYLLITTFNKFFKFN